ncbi:hypothetical protein EC32303_A0084 [Escherichia coli 3.2303]|nr:hypothetical protein EC32303_A0084 [Escherichia coli 3.2303]
MKLSRLSKRSNIVDDERKRKNTHFICIRKKLRTFKLWKR